MTSPTARVIQQTRARDDWKCVACGAETKLTWHPRQEGRDEQSPALTNSDGITACKFCANAFRNDSHELALHMGWVVRKNTLLTCLQIPIFDRNTHSWWLLGTTGGRQSIHPALAAELINAAGAYVTLIERRVG